MLAFDEGLLIALVGLMAGGAFVALLAGLAWDLHDEQPPRSKIRGPRYWE